jgi:hypothetical protein
MMMPNVIVIVVVKVPVATVSAAFRLEGGHHLCEIRSKPAEHILDYMIGPKAKNLVSNFSRQMPISQMPGKTHKLIGILVTCFDNKLGSGLNLEPPPVVELQAISIGHCNRFRKVEKDIFALIRSQANAAAMARVKVESESTCRLFLRPVPGEAMDGSAVDGHIST